MGNGCYETFASVSSELLARLSSRQKEYLKAIDNNPQDAPRCLRVWEEHFDCAVKGATTVQALQQLQGLPAPNPKLTTKLVDKLHQFEKRELAASMRRTTSPQQATA
jgi:hypothetical protein